MPNAPDLPPEMVEAALAEYMAFATRVVPLLRAACLHAKGQVTTPPPAGARCPEAERQLYPGYVRLAMHQLIEGYNRSAARGQGEALRRRHIRNGAVCMVVRDSEFRMLKASKLHPTRPSGQYQEALITQAAYWDLVNRQSPLFRMDRFLLNGLIYYQVENMELLDAFVVIPAGFNERGGVVHAKSQPVPVSEDLESLATFDAGNPPISLLPDTDSTILSPEPSIPLLGDLDPYADPGLGEETDEFQDASEESILDQERATDESDDQRS